MNQISAMMVMEHGFPRWPSRVKMLVVLEYKQNIIKKKSSFKIESLYRLMRMTGAPQ